MASKQDVLNNHLKAFDQRDLNGICPILRKSIILQSKGQLGPRLWRGFEASMRDLNGYPGIQAWRRLRSHWFSEEFAKHINRLQETAKPARMYRESNPDQ